MSIDDIPTRLTQKAAKRLTAEQMEEVRNRLSKAPPGRIFNSTEAAIYTRRSLRTIKRAIDAGVGPERQKGKSLTGSLAVNQHTLFAREALDVWMGSITSFETVATGAFYRMDDLVREEPWIIRQGVIHGHLFDAGDIEAVLALLEAGEVEFLRLDEALAGQWVSVDARTPYHEALLSVLDGAKGMAESAMQRDLLAAATMEVR